MNYYINYIGITYWYLEDNIQRPYTDYYKWIDNQFYIKGKLVHRDDGPAIEYPGVSKEYYQYGKLHRIGGPAIELANGSKLYHENGKLHREDGPAIEYSDGEIQYWLCNKRFETKEEWEHYRDYLMIME